MTTTIPAGLAGTPDISLEYEIYQEDVMVASSNSLAHAEQYAEQYRQDGPVELVTCVRIPGLLAAAPTLPAGAQDEPITVALDPDPRGVSVGVWQGSRCIYTGAHAVPVAPGDAQDEREADACPRCYGSGEITVMSDNSPDAHEVDVCCDHCQGSGSAADAAKFLAAALAGEKFRHMQLWGEYRNFHRSLCARFGYGHDEVHFRRDLVSLEEAIAAKVAAPAAGDALDVVRLRRIAWLIGSIFVHGDFKAETVNERELEKLLRENRTFWDSLEQFDAAQRKGDA